MTGGRGLEETGEDPRLGWEVPLEETPYPLVLFTLPGTRLDHGTTESCGRDDEGRVTCSTTGRRHFPVPTCPVRLKEPLTLRIWEINRQGLSVNSSDF